MSLAAKDIAPDRKRQAQINHLFGKRKLTGLSKAIQVGVHTSTLPPIIRESVGKFAVSKNADVSVKKEQPNQFVEKVQTPKSVKIAPTPKVKAVSTVPSGVRTNRVDPVTKNGAILYRTVKAMQYHRKIRNNILLPAEWFKPQRDRQPNEADAILWDVDPYNRSHQAATDACWAHIEASRVNREMSQDNEVITVSVSDCRGKGKPMRVPHARPVALEEWFVLHNPIKSFYKVGNSSEVSIAYWDVVKHKVSIGDLQVSLGDVYTRTLRYKPEQYDWTASRNRGLAALNNSYVSRNGVSRVVQSLEAARNARTQALVSPVQEDHTQATVGPVTADSDTPPWYMTETNSERHSYVSHMEYLSSQKVHKGFPFTPSIGKCSEDFVSSKVVVKQSNTVGFDMTEVDAELKECFAALKQQWALENHFSQSTQVRLKAKYGMSRVEYWTAVRHRKAAGQLAAASAVKERVVSSRLLDKLREKQIFKMKQEMYRQQNEVNAKLWHERMAQRQSPSLERWFDNRPVTMKDNPQANEVRLSEWLECAEKNNPSIDHTADRHHFEDAYRYEQVTRVMDYANLFSILSGEMRDDRDLTIPRSQIPVPVGEPYTDYEPPAMVGEVILKDEEAPPVPAGITDSNASGLNVRAPVIPFVGVVEKLRSRYPFVDQLLSFRSKVKAPPVMLSHHGMLA